MIRLLLILTAWAMAADGPEQRPLTLALGISKTLEFPFEIGPIYLTDPSLFDYRRIQNANSNRKLLLIPKNPGMTDFTIHDESGTPRVTYLVRATREEIGLLQSQLETLLGDIEGLRFTEVGGALLLDGEILLPKDMFRIIRVLDAIKDRDAKKKVVRIRNLVSVSKTTMNILAAQIEREVGSPEITVRALNNNLLFEGTAESEFEADRAIEIAKTYLPEALIEKTKNEESPEVRFKGNGVPAIVDLLRVRPRQPAPPAQDILVSLSYVELKNDYHKYFSFKWNPLVTENASVRYDTALGEFAGTLVGTVSSLLPSLDFGRDHGHARIIKQDQILVKDRAETPAVIESSLDIYSPVTNERGDRSLQAIPVQNFTKVKAATIPGSDSIDLGIQVSLASLAGGGGAPQISRNSIQTQVIAKNGEAAALGGHGINEALASYNRDPKSSRSKDFGSLKHRYVIFITPTIHRTALSAAEDVSKKFRLAIGE